MQEQSLYVLAAAVGTVFFLLLLFLFFRGIKFKARFGSRLAAREKNQKSLDLYIAGSCEKKSENALAFLSGLAAVSISTRSWLQSRIQPLAFDAFNIAYENGLKTLHSESESLACLIPAEILEALRLRADRCWSRYREVLNGDHLPQEIDEATRAVKQCLCRELRLIKELNNQKLPTAQMVAWWEAFDCKNS